MKNALQEAYIQVARHSNKLEAMCPKGEKDIRKHSLNAELYEALLKEDAEKVKELCENDEEQGLHILTIHDDTVLQAATYSNQSELVLSLLDALPARHLDKMTRQNLEGNTLLHDAAASNSSQSLAVAKKVLEKAPGLLCMRNHLGETALFRAVRHGKMDVIAFLEKQIGGYDKENQQPFLQRSDKTTILHMAILVQHFGN
jgi:ankyrin repeat protein